MGCGASREASGTLVTSGAGCPAAAASLAVDPPAQAKPSVELDMQLAARLRGLGMTASIELSPAQAHSPKLKYTLVGALDAAAGDCTTSPLHVGTKVFVNMVKKNINHFDDVGAAAAELRGRGMVPVPHLPASRFDSEEQLETTLAALARRCTGDDTAPGCTLAASELLLLGGNDQRDREIGGSAFGSASELLATGALLRHGFDTIVLAGHPEGHPGLGKSSKKTMRLLSTKVHAAVTAGHSVAVASQFCFDAQVLVRWLAHTRAAVNDAIANAVEEGAPEPTHPRYYIGVPGPTKPSKLRRIAEICEVPSLFLGSAFDILDVDGDGQVDQAELLAAAAVLSVGEKELSQLYAKHSGTDKVLQRPELAQLLVELGADMSTTTEDDADDSTAARSISGPSAFVSDGPQCSPSKHDTQLPQAVGVDEMEVWPEELVLALAAYCEQACVPEGEVTVHVFPFGGVRQSVEMLRRLRTGDWPSSSTH
eukprot:COSAG02_NODE_3866_length_6121_cov_318.011956_2_plen_482_part_00